MPSFVTDYLGDTMHLTTEEHGAYLLLLFGMWARGGAVPDNDGDNAAICRLSRRNWNLMKPRLMPFLTAYGPTEAVMLTQERLQREWNYAQARRAKQVEKGIKSGASRRGLANILKQIP